MIVLIAQLGVVLGLLFGADRWLHRHLQSVMYLLTDDRELALWLYAIVLLPGVALHELSHALVAVLVGVDIGEIHLLPKRSEGRIQLGFVPVEETDFVRASLIGGAPLFFGGAAVVALGHWVFGTPEVLAALSQGAWWEGLRALISTFRAPDVWLWAYLVFAFGNTMLPSRSDMHAWPFLLFALMVLVGLAVFIGGGSLLLEGVGQVLTLAARWLVLLGASTLLVDLPFFILILISEKILERVKGVRLEYE